MNFFNRAIKNVTRKFSKSILLILTFFIIGNFVIIGLSVAKASDSAKTLARQKMRAVITYQIDYDAYYYEAEQIEDEDERNKFYENYPKIMLSDVKELIKDERVKTANVLASQTLYANDNSPDFVHLNNEVENNLDNGGGQQCYIDEFGNQVCEAYVEPTFFVKGNYLPDMIEIADGNYSIVSGRFYTQEEINDYARVCLVSKKLAEANNLEVGDRVSFSTGYGYMSESIGLEPEDLMCELEIVGIYDHDKPVTPDMQNYNYIYPYENPDNMILMPASTIYALTLPAEQKYFDYYRELYPEDEYYQDENNRPTQEAIDKVSVYDVTVLLNDPLEVDGFVEEYTNSVGEYKKLNANNEEFKRLSKPLDTLSDYAKFIVYLVVFNAIVIITLVTALTLKTREYEIGVLLSIGASKFKVILQFFVELAIVALVGFTLAVGSGSIISKQIGYTLLENQIQSNELDSENKYDDMGVYYYGPWDSNYNSEISLDDIVNEYEVTVSPLIIGEIYVVGLAIVFVSVIIPSIMVMRFNPKKILMNQY